MKKEKKQGLIVCAVCMMISLAVVGAYIVSNMQYKEKKERSIEHTAIVSKVEHGKVDKIYITYHIDGQQYDNELKTDTFLSFEAGVGTALKEGDQVTIYYNSENPLEILTEKTTQVGLYCAVFGGFSFLFFLVIFMIGIKGSRKM